MEKLLKKTTVFTLCTVMFGLFLVVGCKKDDEKKPPVVEPEYPIDVPFTALEGVFQTGDIDPDKWENLLSGVLIINSNEEMENYLIRQDDGYPEIDFSKKTLLLACKTSSSSAYGICNSLQQLSEKNHEMNVDCYLTGLAMFTLWQVPIIVDKLSEECTIELNVATYPMNQPFHYQ